MKAKPKDRGGGIAFPSVTFGILYLYGPIFMYIYMYIYTSCISRRKRVRAAL